MDKGVIVKLNNIGSSFHVFSVDVRLNLKQCCSYKWDQH